MLLDSEIEKLSIGRSSNFVWNIMFMGKNNKGDWIEKSAENIRTFSTFPMTHSDLAIRHELQEKTW